MPLTPEQFEQAWPRVTRWITQLLADHALEARQVGELGFRRLPLLHVPAQASYSVAELRVLLANALSASAEEASKRA